MRAMFVDMTMSKMRSAAANGPTISEEEVLAKLIKIDEKKNEASASVSPQFLLFKIFISLLEVNYMLRFLPIFSIFLSSFGLKCRNFSQISHVFQCSSDSN